MTKTNLTALAKEELATEKISWTAGFGVIP